MFEIRDAMLEDCRGIAMTQVDSYRTAYVGLFPVPYLEHFTYTEEEQDWIQMFHSGTDDLLLVALSPEKQVVGYLLARAKPDIFPGYDSEIVALHVQPAFQRNGIEKALLSHAIERLKSRGCKSVMLWTLKNNKVRQWYEKLHGKLIGEKSYEVDDWVISEVAYGWKEISALSAN